MNEPQNTNEQPQTVVEVPKNDLQNNPQEVVPVAKKKRSVFPVVIAFLAGAVCYALLAMGYNLYTQEKQASQLADAIVQDIAHTDGVSLTTPATAGTKQGTSADPKELANYVNSVNCSTTAPYSKYIKGRSLQLVKSVNVYDGLRVAEDGGGPGILITWTTLPVVVDYQCKPLQLTDIKVGDRVNIYAYTSSTSSPSGSEQLVLIQRAVK